MSSILIALSTSPSPQQQKGFPASAEAKGGMDTTDQSYGTPVASAPPVTSRGQSTIQVGAGNSDWVLAASGIAATTSLVELVLLIFLVSRLQRLRRGIGSRLERLEGKFDGLKVIQADRLQPSPPRSDEAAADELRATMQHLRNPQKKLLQDISNLCDTLNRSCLDGRYALPRRLLEKSQRELSALTIPVSLSLSELRQVLQSEIDGLARRDASIIALWDAELRELGRNIDQMLDSGSLPIRSHAELELQYALVIETFGLTSIRPERGAPVDPGKHRVVARVAAQSFPSGTVYRTLKRGFARAATVLESADVEVVSN